MNRKCGTAHFWAVPLMDCLEADPQTELDLAGWV
jgi:hypothetical protein